MIDYLRVIIAAKMFALAFQIAPKDTEVGKLIRDAIHLGAKRFMRHHDQILMAEKLGLEWKIVNDE